MPFPKLGNSVEALSNKGEDKGPASVYWKNLKAAAHLCKYILPLLSNTVV